MKTAATKAYGHIRKFQNIAQKKAKVDPKPQESRITNSAIVCSAEVRRVLERHAAIGLRMQHATSITDCTMEM